MSTPLQSKLVHFLGQKVSANRFFPASWDNNLKVGTISETIGTLWDHLGPVCTEILAYLGQMLDEYTTSIEAGTFPGTKS